MKYLTVGLRNIGNNNVFFYYFPLAIAFLHHPASISHPFPFTIYMVHNKTKQSAVLAKSC